MLEPGEALTLHAIIGHVGEVGVVNQARSRLADSAFIAAKRAEAQALAATLTDPIATQTGDPRFDAYCRQAMLEQEHRQGSPLRLLMGIVRGPVLETFSAESLLPLSFDSSFLKR